MGRTIRVVGCIIEHDGMILSLLRHREKSAGGTWALPAGKTDLGESDTEAMVREMREETGYVLDRSLLTYLGTHTYQFKDDTIVFVTYRFLVHSKIPIISKPDEHEGYQWVRPAALYALPNLVSGLRDLLEQTGYVPTTGAWTSNWEPAPSQKR